MKRIQRQRTKGWRMPPNTVYVGRPSLWGNPFTVESAIRWGFAFSVPEARRVVVHAFRQWMSGSDDWWMGRDSRERRAVIRHRMYELQGKDLVCWCPLDQPCHADVLLELVTPEKPGVVA